MEQEEKDELQSENEVEDGEIQETETTEDQGQDQGDDQDDDQKDYKKIAEDQRKRAEKAEAENKKLKTSKPAVQPKPQAPQKAAGELTSMDTIALINAKVTEKEDIDEVVDYAKLKNIPISEALKSDVVKVILKDRAEKRATAEATNTGHARRGTSKPSDEQILAKAAKGELPDDIDSLVEARFNQKLKKE